MNIRGLVCYDDHGVQTWENDLRTAGFVEVRCDQACEQNFVQCFATRLTYKRVVNSLHHERSRCRCLFNHPRSGVLFPCDVVRFQVQKCAHVTVRTHPEQAQIARVSECWSAAFWRYTKTVYR